MPVPAQISSIAERFLRINEKADIGVGVVGGGVGEENGWG